MANVRPVLISLSTGQTLRRFRQSERMPKSQVKEAQEFGHRLVELMAKAGQPRRGAGAHLSRRYKVSTVTANDWLNGKFKPGTDLARQIAEDHGSTFEELYFGTKPNSARPAAFAITEAGPDDALPITMMDARGSCGGGGIHWDAEHRQPLMKEPSWFARYRIRPKDAIAVWADGESMADFIVDGDIVIFDKSRTEPRTGQIFLIDHPDGLRIKRLRRDIDGSWVLESSNPDKRRFPDERIAQDQAALLRIVGEFVYRQGG